MSATTPPSAAAAEPHARPVAAESVAASTNFLRNIIERDLREGRYAGRRWGGGPGDAAHHAAGVPDPARIRTRFPPEPNGYPHIGHAKSICLNFGLARDYGGVCHMRFDDTNPEKEEQEYVDALLDATRWLGFDWQGGADGGSHLYHASDYFGFMYRAACRLIEIGCAYVDQQSAEQMRATRGTLTEPGTDSPWRERPAAESLRLFEEMRAGRHPDGSMVLRAKIDMASPNIDLRDPAIYRIRHATHHRSGDAWCVYPMYAFAHPIEDALEQITHSICTLEFASQRPFYDWLLERLAERHVLADGRALEPLLAHPLPRQYEFARLNLTYVVTSKRKLKQLVDEGHVAGWDDPRMPTISGLRRRGYTPSAIALMVERTGVSKSDGWIDFSVLEQALRDDLDPVAPRALAVLEPLALRLVNWAEVFGSPAHREPCSAPLNPHRPEAGERRFTLGPLCWIERGDFADPPPKGYHRLYPPELAADGSIVRPGGRVRLKYGYVVQCTGARRDAEGRVVEVLAELLPDTKSGTPGADQVKVKAAIGWVGAHEALAAEFRLYDRLFRVPQPGTGDGSLLDDLNPHSLAVAHGYVEPALAAAQPDDKFQFERLGYFVADRVDHRGGTRAVFNRAVGLKDGWGK